MQELKPQEKCIVMTREQILLCVGNGAKANYIAPVEDIEEALTAMTHLARAYKQLEHDDIGIYNTNLEEIRAIECDLSEAVDEFLLVDKNNNSIPIEVVTAEVAERNDRDFLRDDEQRNDYELGKTWSYYTPLSNDKQYYYRLL